MKWPDLIEFPTGRNKIISIGRMEIITVTRIRDHNVMKYGKAHSVIQYHASKDHRLGWLATPNILSS